MMARRLNDAFDLVRRDGRIVRGAGRWQVRRFAWTLVVVVGLAGTDLEGQTFSDPQPKKATLAIVGGYLIDGHEGPPLHHSLVLVDGKEIVAVGTVEGLKVPPGAKVIDARGYTVLPGLIDAHVHTDHLGHGDYVVWHQRYSSANKNYDQIHEIAVRQLLMAGVTTAVDLAGDPGVKVRIRDEIDRGAVIGPRMIMSCGWIWNVPDAQVASYYRRFDNGYLNVHTPEEARAAVQKIIAAGADIIKLNNGLTGEQVKVIAEEAHRRRLKVTGHVGGDEDLLARIRNGQDAIEHYRVNADNPEVVRELLARRTVLVPTAITPSVATLAMTEVPGWIDNPRARALTPPDIWADLRTSLLHFPRMDYFRGQVRPRDIDEIGRRVKKLYDAGVRLVIGTDSGTKGNFHTDSTWREMDLFVRFGIPPIEVISMATRLNAEYLGKGDKLGTIEPGKLADIIVVDGNPLSHMADLRRVVHVVKDGLVYQGLGYADYVSLSAPGKTSGSR